MGAVMSLNEKLKKNVNQLVTLQKVKSSGVGNYLQDSKITSIDVFKYLAVDGTLKNYSNMALLFKISLLIPPSTSKVERRFSKMDLLCTLLWSSLSETNLDWFMRMCINGHESQTLSVKNFWTTSKLYMVTGGLIYKFILFIHCSMK